MKRTTPGVTTALVPAAASTVGAGAAPGEAETISTALGLAAGEQLVPRDVVPDADGTQHLRFDRTLNGLKVIGQNTSGTKYAAARTGTLAATADLHGATSAEYAAVDRAWAAVNIK